MTITISGNDTSGIDTRRTASPRGNLPATKPDGVRDNSRKAQVQARRDAALERLNGGRPREVRRGLAGRAGGWARGSVARTKPSRRAVQRPLSTAASRAVGGRS